MSRPRPSSDCILFSGMVWHPGTANDFIVLRIERKAALELGAP